MADVTLGGSPIHTVGELPAIGTASPSFTLAGTDGVAVLCISNDRPFAHARFCGAEGTQNITTGSAFRSDFEHDFGVTIAGGPMAGLLASAVVAVAADGTVAHAQLVDEIAAEPDDYVALAAIG